MEVVLDCPDCGKPKHLYANTTKRVYICFRCDSRGRLSPELSNQINLSNQSLSSNPKSNFSRDLKTSNLSQFAYTYLTEDRKLEPRLLKHLPILSSENGIAFGFPYEDVWQERTWNCSARWLLYSKDERPSNGCLYQADLLGTKTVFIVEGVIDALSLAPFVDTVATLSYRITPAQAKRLSNIYTNAVYFPDNDVKDKEVIRALETANEFLPTRLFGEYYPDECKDPSNWYVFNSSDLKRKVGNYDRA